MGMTENYKDIISLNQIRSPSEIKDLKHEQFLIRKVHKLEKFFKLSINSDIKQVYSLGYNNTNYHSYTFYPPDILDIINILGLGE